MCKAGSSPPLVLSAVWKTLLMLIVLVVGSMPANAETVVSCKEFGFSADLTEGEGLLHRYYHREGGVGGLGCWVHKHPGFEAFVITPYSWGRNPNPGKRGLIKKVFQAMTDSKRVFQTLGSFNTHPYYLIDDVKRSAETQWINDRNECWIEGGPKRGHGSWRENGGVFFIGQVAHELGHCFIMENLRGYTQETYDIANANWWDESGANFLSSIVYPKLNYEHNAVARFDLDGGKFTQPYSASVLFSSYANSTSNPAVIALIRGIFYATKDDSRKLFKYLREAHFAQHYHKFVVDHYLSQVSDPGGGFFPREPIVENIYETTLEEGEHTLEIPALMPGLLNVVGLTVPRGMRLTIQPPDIEGVSQAVVENMVLKDMNWTNPVTLQTQCDVVMFDILFSHLNDTGVGAELKYRLEPIEGRTVLQCCEHSHRDRCLIGSWRANEKDYKAMLEDVVRQFNEKGMTANIRSHTFDIRKVDNEVNISDDNVLAAHHRINGKGVFDTVEGKDTKVMVTVVLNSEGDAEGKICSNKDSGTLDIEVNKTSLQDYGSYLQIDSPEIQRQLESVPPEMRGMIEAAQKRPLKGKSMFVEGVQTVSYTCAGDILSFPVVGSDGITLKMKYHRKH